MNLRDRTLDRPERLVEIIDDVLNVLDSHRDAYHAIGNADFSSSLFAHSCVGHGCRMREDRKSTRLNSSHGYISYAVFCLKKKNNVLTATSDNRKQLIDSAAIQPLDT